VRLLLDTNAVLWWFAGDAKLPVAMRNLLSHDDTTVLVSAASAWEICTKVRIGKLPTAHALCEDFLGFLSRHEFEPLPVSVEHGRLAGRMAGAHKDPFDRMLAVRALIEGVPVVSNDAAFAGFGVNVMW
jgi:PIN domain nuclease of toxin-antitoxin system